MMMIMISMLVKCFKSLFLTNYDSISILNSQTLLVCLDISARSVHAGEEAIMTSKQNRRPVKSKCRVTYQPSLSKIVTRVG